MSAAEWYGVTVSTLVFFLALLPWLHAIDDSDDRGTLDDRGRP
jgi:hypothetical protein